jgi:cellulose synthase/poly-beta-1,6-N-acetylglucosamine synthase-like glycosyltransferase
VRDGLGGGSFVAPILLWLIMFLCLVISVTKYLMGLILRVSFPSAKIRKDYSWQPTVSVLMPCFNEGKTVYQTIESISKSNYPIGSFEVIAQDDCSVDDSFEWMLKAQRDFTRVPIRVGRNDFNCGKARTVCNALEHSKAEIIISIDSDCIFHPDAIRELTACFAEPGIGSVGGRVGVSNPNDGVITAIQTMIYYSAFELYKIPENWTRSVCCISGCLFAIRRELLLEIEPAIRARHWFGIPVNQGEDRFLTHQTLLRGYGTYINNDALCWTTVPNSLGAVQAAASLAAEHCAGFFLYAENAAAARLQAASQHGVDAGADAARRRGGAAGGGDHADHRSDGLGGTRAAGGVPGHRRRSELDHQEIQRPRDHPASTGLRRLHCMVDCQLAFHHAPGALHHGLGRLGHTHQGT